MPAPNRLINHDGAYCFDVRNKTWRTLRPLPHPNRGLSAVPLDERHILLSGGYTASEGEAAGKPPDFGFTAAAMIYDIARNEYHTATPPPFPVAGAETLLLRHTVFALGGEDRMRGRTARVLTGKLE